MTENEKIELFDKWYDENYDEWAEGEEGIALREELEQAFMGGIAELEKENAELRKIAEFQQSSNMQRHFENKKLKEGLAVGSTWNKHLNSLNKALEEERDKYRDMVFDLQEENAGLKEKYVKNITDCDICDTYCNSQLTKAKEEIRSLYSIIQYRINYENNIEIADEMWRAKQFLKDNEVEK